VNAQAAVLLGVDRDALIGRSLETLVPARVRERFGAHWHAYGLDPQPRAQGLELLALHADGTEIPVELRLTPVPTDAGLLTAASLRDVRQEQALRRHEQKAQKMEAVALFVGGIAHDANNQLTAILGYAEMLLSQIGPDKPSWADLQEIHKAAIRLAALTKQLLAFTRQQVLHVERVVANDVIRNTQTLLTRALGAGVRLACHLAPDLRPIQIDVSQLEQIITNLALNARDAMPHGGTLTIATANLDVDAAYARTHVPMTPGAYVMLTVRDTGVGMDEATKGRIFEPFFTTKGAQGGTGLGLPTVFGIVKQLNGFLWVDSAPGQGTTFTIHFPAAAGPPSVRTPADARTAAPLGLQTILVVDDEDGVRHFTLRALRRHGYRVLEAASPHEALALLERPSEAIHLVVTDIAMPGMTGLELVARLGPTPAFKVLFTSGYTDPKKLGGTLDDAQAFLAKPFSVQQLLHKVHELLMRSAP
jgi:PAS domain S-box-containing protein